MLGVSVQIRAARGVSEVRLRTGALRVANLRCSTSCINRVLILLEPMQTSRCVLITYKPT